MNDSVTFTNAAGNSSKKECVYGQKFDLVLDLPQRYDALTRASSFLVKSTISSLVGRDRVISTVDQHR